MKRHRAVPAGFFRRPVGAVGGKDLGKRRVIGDIVQLVDVDAVGSQILKALADMLLGRFGIPPEGLRRDDDLVADIAQGLADLLFAVPVYVCRIEKGDPQIIAVAHDLGALLKGQRDDGDPAESDFRDDEPRAAQLHFFHFTFPSVH